MNRSQAIQLATRVVVAGLALAAAMVLVGRAFVGSNHTGLVQPVDDSLRGWTQSHLAMFDGAAALLASVGATVVLLAVAIVITAVLWLRTRNPAVSLLPALAVLIADTVGAFTKVLVARPRPTGEEIGLLEHFSFPSGHTVAATALAGGLYLVWRSARPTRSRWPGVVIVTVVAVVVGIARIVVDAHWTTDVVAGTAVGFASAAIAGWALTATFDDPRPDSEAAAADPPPRRV